MISLSYLGRRYDKLIISCHPDHQTGSKGFTCFRRSVIPSSKILFIKKNNCLCLLQQFYLNKLFVFFRGIKLYNICSQYKPIKKKAMQCGATNSMDLVIGFDSFKVQINIKPWCPGKLMIVVIVGMVGNI